MAFQPSITTARPQIAVSDFISKVCLWMAGGLAVSALAAFWTLAQPGLMQAIFTKPALLIGLVIAEFALVIWLSAAHTRMSAGLATSLYFGYAFLNGVTLSAILIVYTSVSIMITFAVTAGTFLFFAVYGATTKRDLTSIGGFAVMGLIGIILASVVNIFLKSSGLMWVTTFIGIGVFMALTAWDMQKLKAIHAAGIPNGAVMGALALYLDFINLFLLLLRIFGRQRN